jgi:hypothetical protein
LQLTKEPKLINNRKICLYTNHQLYETHSREGDQNPSPAKYFSTIPASPTSHPTPKTLTTSSYDWEDYDGENAANRCPDAGNEEYLTVLHTKLNPDTPYGLTIDKGLMDIYGHTLTSNVSSADGKKYTSNAA